MKKLNNEGAKVLLGGKRPAGFNKGFFYEPTIFNNVKDNYTIMKQEPFGPLVPMLSFKSFDEVIERANNHELGLCSYICTNSMEKAQQRLLNKWKQDQSQLILDLLQLLKHPLVELNKVAMEEKVDRMAIKDYLKM